MAGIFCISLDFELMWGVKDSRTMAAYGPNILGVRDAIPAMLKLFESHALHASWATVGFLFHREKAALLKSLPDARPSYTRPGLSNYDYLEEIGQNEQDDPYHYGASLIDAIQRTAHQEIASHSFSHFYCCEPGATPEQFEADITASQEAAKPYGFTLRSFVFPRNQYSDTHRQLLQKHGFSAIRGNESHWAYDMGSANANNRVRRAFRLADSYVNLSGYHTYQQPPADPMNVPASRFLRPYHPRLRQLEPMKLARIKRAMTHAAERNELFHLWWHPHNFGRRLEENIHMLASIARHYTMLAEQYDMRSLTMAEVAEQSGAAQAAA